MMLVQGVLLSVLQSQPQCKMAGGMKCAHTHTNILVVFHTLRERMRQKGVTSNEAH